MKKTVVKLVAIPLFVIAAFCLGIIAVQAVNRNNIVPMNDETQACQEACGLGNGQPTGDLPANECLNNCFAAIGIGNVKGSCSQTADNRYTAFASPGQDPDCSIGLDMCFSSLSQHAACEQLGGTFVSDATCGSFTEPILYSCIACDFDRKDCSSVGGNVAPTDSCSSGKGCFTDLTLSGRCEELICPHFNDIVQYGTINNTTGEATFTNLNDERSYTCSLIFDQSSDTFNCKTDPFAGQQVKIISLGLSDATCQNTLFNIGIENVPGVGLNNCSYRCSIQP